MMFHAGIASRLFGSASHHIIGVTMVKADGSVVGG
jgi:FAD/FMN-containing dehydrogenase